MNLSSMTSCLAAPTVQITQIYNREVEGSALEMGAKTEHSYITVQKKRDFFLVLFCFPISSCLLKKNVVGKLDGKKTSASFIPVGA